MNSKRIRLYLVTIHGNYQAWGKIDTVVQSYTILARNENEAIQQALKDTREKWPEYALVTTAGEIPKSQIEEAARALGMRY